MIQLENGAPASGAPSSLILTGIVVVVVFLLAWYPSGPVVVIQVAGYHTHRWATETGQLLIYHYVHSLERVSVFEYLRVEEQGLLVVGSRQQAVDSGPLHSPGSARDLIPPASAAQLRVLRILVTPGERQSLTLGNQHMDLSGYKLGSAVEVRVARAPWLWLQWRRLSF